MPQLIRTPGGYWSAFFKGYLGTVGAMAGPLVGIGVEAHPTAAALPSMIGVLILIAASAGVVVGIGFVVPRWLYAWAYRRVSQT